MQRSSTTPPAPPQRGDTATAPPTVRSVPAHPDIIRTLPTLGNCDPVTRRLVRERLVLDAKCAVCFEEMQEDNEEMLEGGRGGPSRTSSALNGRRSISSGGRAGGDESKSSRNELGGGPRERDRNPRRGETDTRGETDKSSELVVLAASCQHVFHRSCLERWLVRKGHCPKCRESVDRAFADAERAATKRL